MNTTAQIAKHKKCLDLLEIIIKAQSKRLSLHDDLQSMSGQFFPDMNISIKNKIKTNDKVIKRLVNYYNTINKSI